MERRHLATSRCEHAWRSQRPANDWAGFLENFREVVAVGREEAARLSDELGGGGYEALMDRFEPGMTTAEVYSFVRRAGAGRAIAVKGQDGLRAAIGQPAATEVRRNGRKLGGLKVWPVGSSFLKGETYGWLKLDRPGLVSFRRADAIH